MNKICKKNIIILGGGLAGLSTSYFLQKNNIESLVLEKSDYVGGTARTVEKAGYFFDLTGHALHLSNSKVKEFIFEDLELSDKLTQVNRISTIYLNGKYIPYPFQYNLSHLDEEQRNSCVIHFLEAHYNNIKNGFSDGKRTSDNYKTFDEYCHSTLGRGISEKFMIPYNEKLWACKAEDMGLDWMGKYVPKPNFEDIMEGAFIKKEIDDSGYNAYFYYPKEGGIQILSDSIHKKIGDNVLLNKEVTKIDLENKKVYCVGDYYDYDYLISTIPLPELLDMSDTLKIYKDLLKWTVVRAFFVTIPSEKRLPYTWIYVPEKDNDVYRIGNFSLFSPNLSVNEKDILYVETSKQNNQVDELPEFKDIRENIAKIMKINKDDIELIDTIDINPAYQVYDTSWRENVSAIKSKLEEYNVFIAGRYGSWKYESMEDSIIDGINVVDTLLDMGETNEK